MERERLCVCVRERERERERECVCVVAMGDQKTEVYFVFMNFDPKYERLHADRWVEL